MRYDVGVKSIRSKYLAGWLMYKKGLNLVAKIRDKENLQYDSYLFEDTSELKEYMTEYIKMREQEKASKEQ